MSEWLAAGSTEDLHRWGQHGFHVDLDDTDVCVALAAHAVTTGAWRNNSLIEDIHAGAHPLPGQEDARGLRDEEMFVASVQTSQIVRQFLHPDTGWLDDEDWWVALTDAICDPDRPLAGTPLSAHVPAHVLEDNADQVARNLHLFEGARLAVGPGRFLRGLALVGADAGRWGSPMWPVTVRAWAKVEHPDLDPAIVDGLITDPGTLVLSDVRAAINGGLRFFDGRAVWHRATCGNPHHTPSDEDGLGPFLGFIATLSGLPTPWMGAAAVTVHGADTLAKHMP